MRTTHQNLDMLQMKPVAGQSTKAMNEGRPLPSHHVSNEFNPDLSECRETSKFGARANDTTPPISRAPQSLDAESRK